MAKDRLSFDEQDELRNPPPAVTEFDEVVATALSRRGFLGGVMTFGLGSFLVGTTALTSRAEATSDRFGFTAIADQHRRHHYLCPKGSSGILSCIGVTRCFPDATRIRSGQRAALPKARRAPLVTTMMACR